MKRFLSSFAIIALALAGSISLRAQSEITLIAPFGAKAPLDELLPAFEAKSGYKVKPTYGSGLGTKKQVTAGEAFDVPVVQPPYQDVLASGNVVANTATPLATVSVGVAVRKGAPKPDISTPDAVKRMLLAAKSISYPDPKIGAAAGVSFEQTLSKLGIAEQMKPKVKAAQGGGTGAMAAVASGDVEIGLTFLSEINDPGVDIIGPLPREISPPTGLVGFVSAHAKDAAAAKALLQYLSSPEAAKVYKAHRMEPGS